MRYFTRVLILAFISGVVTLASCRDEKIVFEAFQTFDGDLEWKKSDVKSFDVPIAQPDENLDVILSFRCATGYAYQSILIDMQVIDPLGNVTNRLLDIPVRNATGEFFGEKGFDIVDIEYAVELSRTFDAKGLWKFSFHHQMPQRESIDFAMELGLILRAPKAG